MILRGLRKRCGRCGAKARFRRYYRLAERCCCCGYRFAREEGFFTGVYLINYSFTALVLVAAIFGFLVHYNASGEGTSLAPYYVIGAAIILVLPVWLYPRAATTWAALDLLMRPLEPDEEADAVTWIAANEDERCC